MRLSVLFPLLICCNRVSNGQDCQRRVTELRTKVLLSPLIVAANLTETFEQNSRTFAKFTVFKLLKSARKLAGDSPINRDIIVLPTQLQISSSEKVCLSQKDLQRNPKLILFLNKFGNVSLFRPVKYNKSKAAEIVEYILDAPSDQVQINKAEVTVGSQFHLNCKIKGQPHADPDLIIAHNGHLIEASNSVVVEDDSSKLWKKMKVSRFTEDWSGTYECMATKPDGQSNKVKLLVEPKAVNHNTTVFGEIPCTNSLLHCENGGTCFYQPSLSAASCKCAYGYVGKRCQYKDVAVEALLSSNNAIKGYQQNMILAGLIYGCIFLIMVGILAFCIRKKQQVKKDLKSARISSALYRQNSLVSDTADSLPPTCPYCNRSLSNPNTPGLPDNQTSPIPTANGGVVRVEGEIQPLLKGSVDVESGRNIKWTNPPHIVSNQRSNTYPSIDVNGFRKDRKNAVSDNDLDSPKSPSVPVVPTQDLAPTERDHFYRNPDST